MLDFRSFLEEGRDAPVFHGTTLKNLDNILKDDTINGYVSISRNLQHAKWLTFHKNMYYDSYHCVIVLDQRKLSQRYKIVPINDSGKFLGVMANERTPMHMGGDGNNEFEERILTNIKNVKNFIKFIYVFSASNRPIDSVDTDYISAAYSNVWKYKKLLKWTKYK